MYEENNHGHELMDNYHEYYKEKLFTGTITAHFITE